MAQVSQITLDNVTFAQFRSDLNNSLNALNTGHLGSSRPSSAVAGTIWLDNSATNTIAMKLFDGTDDLELFSINTSTNAITLPSGVSITETDPSAIPFSIALG
ncbi:MAG: hypothetical protein HKN40_12595 [Winogradskyella sp.]|uniref:hypothetical protein n=1 Tax=Winogradskyella sp. TaxID=1883156 RepID=UPI00182AFAE0|nr:hypothetical protein [Winogradskyella sp.]